MFKRSLLILTFLLINQAYAAVSPGPKAEEQSFAAGRAKMVETLKQKGIKDSAVLASMDKVQRHEFAPEKYIDRSYKDMSLPLGNDSTISQPYMVALMIEAIRARPGQKVLEIGTASGYSAAVLSEIVGDVYTIEIDQTLAAKATSTLAHLGYSNVHVRQGDGFYGWPEEAPFDAIIITCSADKVPPRLIEQLKEGGRMVMPLGDSYSLQTLAVITKTNGKMISRPLVGVQFVPMVGEIKK